MATLNIREVPDDIASAVEAAAAAAGVRSREAYLRDFLVRSFSPKTSVTAAIAARARYAVSDLIEPLGRFGILKPPPTIPLIARALGHHDTSLFEAELRGDRPLSFSDGDRLCTLFGLSRSWLESGEKPIFSITARYQDSRDALHDFLTRGIEYDWLYFILADGQDGSAAIIGHRTPRNDDDLERAWQYELLVDEIPIHDEVGGTGRANRREFADLMVALYDDNLFPQTTLMSGVIIPYGDYEAVISGDVHPATRIITRSPLPNVSCVARASHWYEDFWSFDRAQAYTENYHDGRNALLKELRADGITNREQYSLRVRKMIQSWRSKAS